MVFPLDTTLSPQVAPLAWLVGHWRGAGVYGYPTSTSGHFGQEVTITHDGRPFLEMQSHSWLLDESGEVIRQSATELGVWRVLTDGEVELLLTHPTGIVEMYVGRPDPDRPALHLHTDSVVRSPQAKEYNSGTRMYGLVDSDLMWVMEMAAMGHDMHPHLSARLKRVD